MIQKKICMVGLFATGKTSLVRQFVHSRFSDKYLSTVGVKIDRKVVNLDGGDLGLVLWDVEGRCESSDVPTSYLRGSHGLMLVADGTRPETLAGIPDLWERAKSATGVVPAVLAVNKADLVDRWVIRAEDLAPFESAGWHVLQTSAKTGHGVEQAFRWLAERTLEPRAGDAPESIG
jgi:small GTP-binding protein